MDHATIIDGVPTIMEQTTQTIEGFQYSPGELDLMSRAEKLAIGVYEVERPDVPAGKHATAWSYAVVGDVVVGTPTLEDIPPGPVTFRQAVIGLKHQGLITEVEAEAWASRTALPALVLNVIATLPLEQQSDARITSLTMTTVEPDNPLIAVAAANQMPTGTPEERKALADSYFRNWRAI